MKKLKVYLPLFVIITILGLSYNVIIPRAYSLDYNEQISNYYKNKMWNLGKNLSIGDSYTFEICDPQNIVNYSASDYHDFTQNKAHDSSLCYIVKLDFVNLLHSDNDNYIWVVQVTIRDNVDNQIKNIVFHINSKTFEVKSADTIHPDTIRYAKSLQNTIFSIYKYSDESKPLKLGTKWGTVTESLKFGEYPDFKVLENNLNFTAIQNTINYDTNSVSSVTKTLFNVSRVGYDTELANSGKVTTSYLISPEFAFPLSSVKYSPVDVIQPFKVFEFQLLSYSLQNNEPVGITIKSDNISDNVTPTNTIPDKIIPNNIIPDKIIPNNIIPDNTNDNNSVTNDHTINNDHVIISNTQDDIINDIKNKIDDTIVAPINPQSDNRSNFILYGLLSIPVIGVIGFAYFKLKNPRRLVKPNKNSLSKIIHFDDIVTIKVNKSDKEESSFVEAKN